MRLIDAESLKTKLQDPTRRAFALEIIDNEPTYISFGEELLMQIGKENPDGSRDIKYAFELVMCSKCKYWEQIDPHFGKCLWLPGGVVIDENWFCADGERREE